MVDKLLCTSRRTSASPCCPLVSFEKKFINVNAVLFKMPVASKFFNNIKIFLFIGIKKCDCKTEAVGKGKLFLHSISLINIIFPVREIFLNQMTSVRRCIYYSIRLFTRKRTFKSGLKFAKRGIVRVET